MENGKKQPLQIVNALWESYRKQVIPPEAGVVQLIESKRAFFSGVYSGLQTLSTISVNIPEDVAVTYLDRIKQECLAFSELVKQGKA